MSACYAGAGNLLPQMAPTCFVFKDLKIFKDLFHENRSFVCRSVCASHVCRVPEKAREGMASPGLDLKPAVGAGSEPRSFGRAAWDALTC